MRSTQLFAVVFLFSLGVMALIGLGASEPIWSDLPRFASVSVFAALQALAVTVLEALALGRPCLALARGGTPERYDHVVLACHADQALRMLADPTPAEREVLGAIRTYAGAVVLVTHDLGAAALAESVLIMRDGRIVDRRRGATPDELLAAVNQTGAAA